MRSALHDAEGTWFAKIAARLDAETTGRVLALVGDELAGDATEGDSGGLEEAGDVDGLDDG
ncbi:hypothetical protein AB0F88_31380 [Streptosporangium sp. NPDC023963]|uniref:hypothetical protein n=1 Tax=Streptosporangium sp. NPDC023963 TaxID=3155608 RepID=UPI003437AB12